MSNESIIVGESFKLKSGNIAEFSIRKHCENLLMLHTPDTSAQWELGNVGVEVLGCGDTVKVGFHTLGGSANYQSWYFDGQEFNQILAFFKSLGFPCPQAIYIGEIEVET